MKLNIHVRIGVHFATAKTFKQKYYSQKIINFVHILY